MAASIPVNPRAVPIRREGKLSACSARVLQLQKPQPSVAMLTSTIVIVGVGCQGASIPADMQRAPRHITLLRAACAGAQAAAEHPVRQKAAGDLAQVRHEVRDPSEQGHILEAELEMVLKVRR